MPLFKLLAGKHTQKESNGISKTYRPGDVIDSKHDLVKLFNSHPTTPKFERVDERTMRGDISSVVQTVTPSHVVQAASPSPAPAAPQSSAQTAVAPSRQSIDGLDSMSVKELQLLAQEEEIDLRGASKKEEIIKIIRGAYGA